MAARAHTAARVRSLTSETHPLGSGLDGRHAALAPLQGKARAGAGVEGAQLTETLPVGRASAPYLSALVASSCSLGEGLPGARRNRTGGRTPSPDRWRRRRSRPARRGPAHRGRPRRLRCGRRALGRPAPPPAVEVAGELLQRTAGLDGARGQRADHGQDVAYPCSVRPAAAPALLGPGLGRGAVAHDLGSWPRVWVAVSRTVPNPAASLRR